MNTNKLVDAYISLMEHLYEAMDDTLHTFADALEVSKNKLSHTLNDVELHQVSTSVERDIKHAAQHLANDNDSLKEWFKFDIELLENFAIDSFFSVADKTRIELERIREMGESHRYKSGDITAPGTFICDSCHKEITFKKPSEIPSCPVCHGTAFTRI